MDDKKNIAAEIICSLISVLKLSNISNENIGALFVAAGNAINNETNEDEFTHIILTHIGKFSEDDESDEDDHFSIRSAKYRIEELFNETATSKQLSRIAKRLHAIQDEDEFKQAIILQPLYVELATLLLKAKNELKSLCSVEKIDFVENKDSWQASASDEEIDREDEIFFFDETIYFPQISEWDLRAVSEALAIKGELQKLQDLEHALKNGYIPDQSKMIAIVVDAVADIDIRKEFNDWLILTLSNLPEGIYQSKIIDEAMIKFKTIGYQQKANNWIKVLEDEGFVSVFKRSNRWWISKAS